MNIIKTFFLSAIIALLSLVITTTPVKASVQMDAQFQATKTCIAQKSIRGSDVPSKIHLTKDKIYHVIAKDRNNESHYLIEMPDENIRPSVRWIAKKCGKFVG